MRGAALALLLFLSGCQCGPGADPLRLEAPDGATLRVSLDPFALTLSSPGGTITRTASPAFAVGTVKTPDPDHYYDPSYDDPVRWSSTVAAGEPLREGDALILPLQLDDRAFLLTLAPAPGGDGFHFALKPTERTRGIVHVRLAFETDARTRIWGLGEFFDVAEHHGRVRNMRFDLSSETEAGDNSRHVRVPNLVTHKAFGLLLENTEPFLADFSDPKAAQLTVVATELSGFFFQGDDPLETLAAEQRTAGTPPLWPAWTYGPQLWRNAVPVICTVACDQGCAASLTGQETVLDDARTLRRLDLPASVIWIDAPWESGFNTFVFNPLQFPDPAAMIQELNALGLRVVVWASPFVNAADDSATMCGMEGANAGGLFAEAAQKGYLLSNEKGIPTQLPWRGTTGALLDFTHPDAFAWWKQQARRAIDLGVDGFKLDFDEYVNPGLGPISLESSLVPFDGSTLTSLHGRYSALFHRAHFEALIEAGHEPYLIGRTGNAFDPAWTTAIWPGDICNGFQRHGEIDASRPEPHVGGLPAAIQAGLSLATSLHPHFGSDIGGYLHGGPESDELFIRWIQYGALATVMQLGGGGDHHNPWDTALYGPEVLATYRRYAGLHLQLFPYLHAHAARNTESGAPILRPLGLAYPDDLAATDAPFEYLFGRDLLVAPVIEAGATTRELTFPAGRWVQWFTGEIEDGPATRTVAAPLDRLPLYVREGAIVPLLVPEVETLAEATAPGVIDRADRADRLLLRLFPGPRGTSSFCLADATCFELADDGAQLSLHVRGAPTARRYESEIAWSLLSATPPTRVEADGRALPFLGDRTALDGAAEGAFFDPNTETLWIKASGAPDLTLGLQ